MGLAETVLARAEPAPMESRAQQVTPWGDWGTASHSSAGVNVTQDTSLNLLAVYGCVSLITDTIATLPRDVFRTKSDGTNEEVTNKPRWLEQPNPSTDIIEFLTQTLTSLLLDGNAYWAYGVDLNFLPTELRVLDPSRVDVRALSDRSGKIRVAYFVNGEEFNGRLLHIKGITRAGSLKGLSPVEAARQSIGLGLAAQEFAATLYRNGVTMSGYITTPGPMTTPQARELRENISRDHGGLSNAHLPGVLTNGATWTSNQVTPEQAQFLATREFQAGEVCAQMFLLDPSMLGIAINRGQNLTYANLSDRGVHLVTYTLLRWIIRIERAVTFLLPRPQFLKLNVDGLKRADMKTRYDSYAIATGQQAWMDPSEVREIEDLPPKDIVQPAKTAPVVAPAPNGTTPVGANT